MIDHGLEAHLGAVGYDLGPCFIDLSWNPVVSPSFYNFSIYGFVYLFVFLFIFSCLMLFVIVCLV